MMSDLVSKECLDCIMEDVREAQCVGDSVPMHPLVLRRMVEEIIMFRVVELQNS